MNWAITRRQIMTSRSTGADTDDLTLLCSSLYRRALLCWDSLAFVKDVDGARSTLVDVVTLHPHPGLPPERGRDVTGRGGVFCEGVNDLGVCR